MNLFATLFLLFSPAALAEGPETIDVYGQRREAQREERPGQSVVFRPEDPSRFDLKALLGSEPSVTLPETGRIQASGFAVPRIRGQDTRLSEVYVEDELLQDPYSGLPLVDDLDVRAFGELQYHQGVAPPELETVSPVGVLRYRERPLTRPTLLVGTTVGRPYGLAGWSLAGTPAKADGASARVYLRQHQTDGRYPYHDANGTPYNTKDDATRIRRNNDRRSAQVLPIFAYRHGRQSYRLLMLGTESEAGLPAAGAAAAGSARQAISARLASLRVRHDTGTTSMIAPDALELRGAFRRDARDTEDPSQVILGYNDHASLVVASRKGGVAAHWDGTTGTGRVAVEEERASVDGDGGLNVSRKATSLYGGASFSLGQAFDLELKYRTLQIDDDRKEADNNPVFEVPIDGQRTTHAAGGSAAFGWRAGLLSAYLQHGRTARPPSLLEEFGDGGRIRGSPSLTSERIRHSEFGTALRDSSGSSRLGLAVFQDDIAERIVFLPTAADTMRAQNLERTRVRGIEARGEASLGDTRISLGFTRLDPRDLTSRTTRILPGVAERYGALSIEQDLSPATLRLGSRYQSQVYRDLGNSIVVPAYTIHDASADLKLDVAETELRIGLAILNVTDVKRLRIKAPATDANDGWSAYGDVDGYPLPGRQWRLSASAAL